MDLFLLVDSLDSEELVFVETPDPKIGDWAKCSEYLIREVLAGGIKEKIYIVSLDSIEEFPVIAVLHSEFEVTAPPRGKGPLL